jgi:spore coat protein U-like protein
VATSTIFGRIPAGQNAVPGTYLTTITVTVNY